MIPIKNIYYLLSYAWDTLDQKEKIKVDADDCKNINDLLAKVLINSTHILIKQGISKNYIDHYGIVYGVKGKMHFAESLKKQQLFHGKTICTYDDYSENIAINRILLTTVNRLITARGLEKTLKEQLVDLKVRLDGIELIDLNYRVFNNIRLTQNTRLYTLVIHVCRLLFENMLPSQETGTYEFADFFKNKQQMNRLFERFIRNFYRREQQDYPIVKSAYIDWKLKTINSQAKELLPAMKTDISLLSESARIIIDAKFYQDTMALHFEKQKIHSGNLYQLFSYLINQRDDQQLSYETTGILLYPTIDQEYDLDFEYEEHPIRIRTVNLNASSQSIATRLLQIISRQ